MEALVGKEEEGAILAVVNIWDPDGAGEIAAVFIAFIGWAPRAAVEVRLCRSALGAIELKQLTMESIGAAGRNHDYLGGLVELCRCARGQHLELREGIE